MNINRKNYEAYLLDLLEGNLSDKDMSALISFLEANPDLKENAELADAIKLSTDTVPFESKQSLYRGELNEQNIEWYLAAQAEGDTTEDENAAIGKFILSNPVWKKQQQLFSLARLTDDKSLRLEDRTLLYRTKTVSVFQRWAFYYAAAAVIAVLLITGFLLFKANQPAEFTAQNEIPSIEFKPDEPVKYLSHPEDSLQPSVNPEQATPNEKTEKTNPLNAKPVKPVYRIMENRPWIAENTNQETDEQTNLSSTKNNVTSESELQKSTEQFQKLETMRNEIAQFIAENSSAFVPEALDKLIERMADGETEISQTELQQLLVKPPTLQASNPALAKTPLLDALAWSLNKISGKNVSLEKKFNDDGRLVAYELDAGLFKIGKEE